MASCSCKVSLKQFKWDRGGYQAVKNSAAVQSILEEHADETCAAAVGMLSPDGYIGESYGMRQITLPKAGDKGWVVFTESEHARRSNAKNNDLLKALR